MKRARRPPRFALALLERLVPESAALAGDLVEEFRQGRSRAWFWWQVLAAVAVALPGERGEIRPLNLVDMPPVEAIARSRRMSLKFPPVNLSGSPVSGVGGIGLVVLSTLMTLVTPAAWLILLTSIGCGVLLGVGLIVAREHGRHGGRPLLGPTSSSSGT
jgi:hypothetical protein